MLGQHCVGHSHAKNCLHSQFQTGQSVPAGRLAYYQLQCIQTEQVKPSWLHYLSRDSVLIKGMSVMLSLTVRHIVCRPKWTLILHHLGTVATLC